MAKLKEFLLDLFYPKKCVICDKWGEFLCSKCQHDLIIKTSQECPSCNAITKKGKLCARCRPKFALSGVVCLGYYKDPVLKKLLHQFKYNGVFSMAPFLGGKLIKVLEKEKILFDAVTFAPLSKKREQLRGYNQSKLLAKTIAEYYQKPLLTGLKKIIETKSQVGLPRKERLKNLSGSFKLAGDLTAKRILVVDDVLTTGATLNECAKALRQAGAKEVWGVTVAKE